MKNFIFFSTRKKKNKSDVENENPINNNMNFANVNQTISTNAPFDPNQQQSAYSSYGTMFNNMNYSYHPLQHAPMNHIQSSPYFINCESCFKCNKFIYLNNERYYRCNSCGRFSCMSCMSSSSCPTPYYQCEYCFLNVALQTTN